MKKILIVGYGSIGKRHKENFETLKCDVALVSRRTIDIKQCYPSIKEGISNFNPDIVFICTETESHFKDLVQIQKSGFRKLILIEKPVFDDKPIEYKQFSDLNIRVTYNLRFNHLLLALKAELTSEKVISAVVYVGQYLPNWRKDVDYRKTYSAYAQKGGGVLLDLSHELDYCNWLFGKATGVFCQQGKWSSLEIDSVDTSSLLIQYENCKSAILHLNYIDRATQRFIVVNTDRATYKLDLISSTFCKDGVEIKIVHDLKDSYMRMSENILFDSANQLTTYAESIDVVNTIQQASVSNSEKAWKHL